MRHVLTLIDGRVVVLAMVLLVLSTASALVMERRHGSGWRIFFALCGTALFVSLTLGNRGIVVSNNGLVDDLTWWARNWGTLPSLVSSDVGWWFNVALFIPAAMGWTVLTERPVAVSLVLLLVVVAIETLQATVLSGAGDPTDVVANGLGIALGVTLALVWLRRSRSAEPVCRASTGRGLPNGR